MSEVDNILEILSKLFSWILSASIMASIIICVILLARVCLRKRLGAKWIYLLWFLLIIRLVSPWAPESPLSVFNLLSYKSNGATVPIIRNTSIYSIKKSADTTQRTNNSINQSKNSNSASSSENRMERSSKTDYFKRFFFSFKTLSVIWLTGSIITALYILITNKRLSLKIRKNSSNADTNILYIFRKCKDNMDIFNDIPLIVTNQVKSPTLFGVIEPRLLLPEQLLGGLSSNQLNYIFLHELAHFKRRDITVNLLTSVLLIFHWFNPLIYYAFYKMREDQETACDASALSFLDPKELKEYALTIIKILESFAKGPKAPVMASFSGTKNQLKSRIRMIKSFQKSSNRWSVTGAVFLILLSLITLTDARAGVLKSTAIVNNPDSFLNNYGADIRLNSKLSFLPENQDERAISNIVMKFLNEVGNTDYRSMTGKEGIEYLVPARQGYENSWIDSRISQYKENKWIYSVYELEVNDIFINEQEARAVLSGKISRLSTEDSGLSNILGNPFKEAFTLKNVNGKWLINSYPKLQDLAEMQTVSKTDENFIKNVILGYVNEKYNLSYSTITGTEGCQYLLESADKAGRDTFKTSLAKSSIEDVKLFKENHVVEKLENASVYLIHGGDLFNQASAKCILTLTRTEKTEKPENVLVEEDFSLQKYNGDWFISTIGSTKH